MTPLITRARALAEKALNPLSKCVDYHHMMACDGTGEGCRKECDEFSDAHSKLSFTIPQLCDALEMAIEALKSISSEHKPRHIKEEYWMAVDHASCATVLATDTLIARNAIRKLRGEG